MNPGVTRAFLAVWILVGAFVTGGAAAEETCGECEEARQTHGWCAACNVGYVGDVAIVSRHLWHILDAHGHELNLGNLGCERCSAALAVDGYCPESKIGFVNRKAYFSRLTWLLARAERHKFEELSCSDCREHFKTAGWCESCGIGRVGRYALADKDDFENLIHDLEILAIANDASTRCEDCAVAIVTDSQCPVCRIRYRAGKAEPQQ